MLHEDLSKEENNPLRFDRIKYIIYFEIISIVNQIIEGNSKIHSLLGIKKYLKNLFKKGVLEHIGLYLSFTLDSQLTVLMKCLKF